MKSQPDLISLSFLLANRLRREVATLMAAETWAAEANLRPGCGGVLRVVAANDGRSQRELADRMGLVPSDMVDLLDRLEAAGYVHRRRDPDDRRRNVVVLTRAGRSALTRFGRVTARAQDRVLEGLAPDERARLVDLLVRVTEAGEGCRADADEGPRGHRESARRDAPPGAAHARRGAVR